MIREGNPTSVDRALDAVTALSTAIGDGKLQQAASAADRLENIRVPVVGLVEATTSAIENGETRRGRLLLGETLRQYDRLRRERGAAVARAIHLRDTADLTYSRRVSMNDFIADERRAAVVRAQFLGAAGAALAGQDGPPEGSRERASNARAELVTLERGTAEAARDIATATVAESTPAVSVLPLSTEPRVTTDAQTTITPVVANVGGQPVDVSLSVSVSGSDPPISVEAVSTDTVTIPPGDSREVTAVLSGTESGTASLILQATSDAATDSRVAEVDVTETLPLALAADRNDNGRIDTGEIQRMIEHWDTGEAIPDTGGLVPDENDLRELLVLWSTQTPIR